MLAAFAIGNNISNWPFETRNWKCFCNSNKLVFVYLYNCSAVQAFLASLLPFLFVGSSCT